MGCPFSKPSVEDTVVLEPITQEPANQIHIDQEPVAQEPTTETPVAKVMKGAARPEVRSKHDFIPRDNWLTKAFVDFTTPGELPIPTCGSVAVPLHKGESIKIINTPGDQVVAT